jgi:hypothetical protein
MPKTLFPLLMLALSLAGCALHEEAGTDFSQTNEGCTDSRLQEIEKQISSGDGLGHGPDIGTDEWKSVIEFRLGLSDDDSTPAPSSDIWCDYIEIKVQERNQ